MFDITGNEVTEADDLTTEPWYLHTIKVNEGDDGVWRADTIDTESLEERPDACTPT